MLKSSFHFACSFTRSKLLILLILLWTVPAFGGSPEVAPLPECKAANGLLNLANADVEAAFNSLGQAMDEAKDTLAARGRSLENYRKALGSSEALPSDEKLNRANATLEQARSRVRSAHGHLEQVMQVFDQRLDTAESRCGGSQ